MIKEGIDREGLDLKIFTEVNFNLTLYIYDVFFKNPTYKFNLDSEACIYSFT
jgi:hypothetical protein